VHSNITIAYDWLQTFWVFDCVLPALPLVEAAKTLPAKQFKK
jgi:hypothetical protein